MEVNCKLIKKYSNKLLLQSKKVIISSILARNQMPVTIGEYTDFYSSKNHAFNMGCIIRGPDNAM